MKDPHIAASPPSEVRVETWPASSPERESIAALFRRLIADVGALMRSEIHLARSEVGASVSAASTGLAFAAIGAVLALVAVVLLLVGVVVWLAEHIGLLAALLGVGAALAIVAALLVVSGAGKLRQVSLAPKRAAASLKRDAQMLKGD